MHRSSVYLFLLASITLAATILGCGPPPSGQALNPRETLESFDWWDNRDWEWYEENIPFFDSPDEELDATYYYRWELLTKHLVYGSPESGYTFTEFIDRPYWAGTYGAISCPLGHQAYEIRWLKDRRIVEDFARYWFEVPGAEPRNYSNWYADAMWATYSVSGDEDFLRAIYPHMEAQVAGWTEERWDPDHQMYRWVGAWDGMETNINSRLTDDAFGGAEGYRPTLNSYLYADFSALSRTAALLGDGEKAASYQSRASALKERVQDELWDPDREFFFHQFAFDEKDGIQANTLTYESGPYSGDGHGRELLGYVPWQFNLPDPGYESAWKFLMDPEFFWTPFGPTGVEQGDPQFFVSPTCCVWSGNAWPYATTQTLAALANLLNNYDQTFIAPADYIRLLRTYARSHGVAGRPYVAEASDPFTGSWAGHNTFYHSEHYLHSGFVDLIITGLVGIRPQAGDSLIVNPLAPAEWNYFALQSVDYHGHDLSVVWDRDGSRYGQGRGLGVFLDGKEVARAPEVGKITIPVPPPPVRDPTPRFHNFAANNEGRHFPFAYASSSRPTAPPFYAVDGNRWYHPSPPNRWVPDGGDGEETWFEVDFGVARTLSELKLYFLDSENGPPQEVTGEGNSSGFPLDQIANGVPILPPDSFEVLAWNGEDGSWTPVPGQERSPERPQGRRANTVDFPPLETSRVRVVLQPQEGASTGFTELEAWGRADVPLSEPVGAVNNLAWNPGDQEYPRIRASFTYPSDSAAETVDGHLTFTRHSRNRWTAYTSPNTEDWLEVDFGAPLPVGRVEIFLYGDGHGIAAPRDFRVERWVGGVWEEVGSLLRNPEVPTSWAVNTVTFPQVEAQRIRVIFRHALPATTGVTELRIWPR